MALPIDLKREIQAKDVEIATLEAKLFKTSADATVVASNAVIRKYVLKVAKAMERGFITRDKGASFNESAKSKLKAAKSKSKIAALVQQLKDKDEVIAEFQMLMKVANNKLSMYKQSDEMSQKLGLAYQHLHSSTQKLLATKYRNKLV